MPPLTRIQFLEYRNNFGKYGAITRPSLEWFDSVVRRGEFVYLASKSCGGTPPGVCLVTPKESGLFVTELHVNPTGSPSKVIARMDWWTASGRVRPEYKLRTTFKDSLTTTHIFSINQFYRDTRPTDFGRLVPEVQGGGQEWSQFIAAVPCPLIMISDISFPTEVSGGERVIGTVDVSKIESAGTIRVVAMDSDTGVELFNQEAQVNGASEIRFKVSFDMFTKILKTRILAQSRCGDRWKTDSTKDITIRGLLPRANIENIRFNPTVPQISKFDLKLDLQNVGDAGKLMANVRDRDTGDTIFSTGEITLGANETRTFEASGAMPCRALNFDLTASALRQQFVQDFSTSVKISPCFASGQIQNVNFPEGGTPGGDVLGAFSTKNIGCTGTTRTRVMDTNTGISVILPEALMGPGDTQDLNHTTRMPPRDLQLILTSEHLECDAWKEDPESVNILVEMMNTSSLNTQGLYMMRGGLATIKYTGVINAREIQATQAISSGVSTLDEVDSPIPMRRTFLFSGTIRQGETHLIPFTDVSYFKIRMSTPMAIVQDESFIRADTDYEFSNIRLTKGLGILKIPVPSAITNRIFSAQIAEIEKAFR